LANDLATSLTNSPCLHQIQQERLIWAQC
jgi:hypothetical protein